MSASNPSAPPGVGRRIIPANLHFLAIYNPTLATNEDTEQDQVFFYHSEDRNSIADKNEQLKQIGLAQGIVSLATGFANGRHPDAVDTEKRRVVLKEIEPDWWILASVNLTCLPAARQDQSNDPSVEYSSREVSASPLLLQQLTTAWRIFLLHHGPSVQELYERLGRAKLCNVLEIYWSLFVRDWDVLLHGNPAADIHDGIKLAAGGELGVGVGEEEWGSSERDVLEDLVRNLTGAVDLVVSRFGQPQPDILDYHARFDQQRGGCQGSWLGDLNDPNPTDGVIFSGVGKISRHSLRTLTDWTRSIYTHGEDTYGIHDNPVRGRRKGGTRRRKPPPLPVFESTDESQPKTEQTEQEGTLAVPQAPRADDTSISDQTTDSDKTIRGSIIPPPIVTAAEESLRTATEAADGSHSQGKDVSADYSMGLRDADTWKKVLTLGYGSMWSIPGLQKADDLSMRSAERRTSSDSMARTEPNPAQESKSRQTSPSKRPLSNGEFLVGLKANLDALDSVTDEMNDELNSRIVKRWLYIDAETPDNGASTDGGSRTSTQGISASVVTPTTSARGKRFSVVVYLHQPFIYVFLFEPNISMLSMPGFFRDIHKHLAPLHKGLLSCTSPANIATRLQSISPIETSSNATDQAPIYELLYNPYSLTVHTSIPNIPMPVSTSTPGHAQNVARQSQDDLKAEWTRVEALSVHSQILQTFADTRRLHEDRECQLKSNRGWWIVWMRLISSHTDPQTSGVTSKAALGFREAILVRKSDDHSSSRGAGTTARGSRSSGFGMGRLLGLDAGPDSSNSSRLIEGVGLDARKYVESLLSLNR